jgi:hypothetical protein
VLGGDHWLPDPQRGPFQGRRWAPGVNRHADYTSDPEWDRAVAIAAGLEAVDPPPSVTPVPPVPPGARRPPVASPEPGPA